MAVKGKSGGSHTEHDLEISPTHSHAYLPLPSLCWPTRETCVWEPHFNSPCFHPSYICKTRHGPDQKYGNYLDRTHCPIWLEGKPKQCQSKEISKSSYLELLGDLEAKGYSASLVTCEISSLGHSLPVCLKDIQELFPSVRRSSIRAMFDAVAKTAISTSFSIFMACKDLVWPSEGPLFTWLPFVFITVKLFPCIHKF